VGERRGGVPWGRGGGAQTTPVTLQPKLESRWLPGYGSADAVSGELSDRGVLGRYRNDAQAPSTAKGDEGARRGHQVWTPGRWNRKTRSQSHVDGFEELWCLSGAWRRSGHDHWPIRATVAGTPPDEP
jgi:hypothetical protein